MIIINKSGYLKYKNHKFKCALGKAGIGNKKIEGDNITPKGIYKIVDIYYREDRIKKISSKFKLIKLTKKMGWCDDSKSKNYNQLISLPSRYRYEKLYRTDNGSTFTILSMGSSSYTGFSIFFLNYDLGWITTPSHILRTTNAGNNWTAVPSGQSSNQWVRDVKFVDELNGWACTDGGGISKTTDGGVNWYNLFYNTSAEVLYDIQHRRSPLIL